MAKQQQPMAGGPTFISYAQNGEDVVLWRALRHISAGRYIDVGACDPVEFSVTKAFYDRGWSGINIEPLPSWAARLREFRPRDATIQVAASDENGTAEFHIAEHTGLSTLVSDRVPDLDARGFKVSVTEVEVRTLDSIIDETPTDSTDIHFLKVDVEGAEDRVLAGLDLGRFRPWIIVVESTELMSSTASSTAGWSTRLLDNGYVHALFDGLNDFYLAQEHADLLTRLSFPAGIHDQPYVASQVPAVREFIVQQENAALVRMEPEFARLHGEIVDLVANTSKLTDEYRVVERTLQASQSKLQSTEHALQETQLAMRATEATLALTESQALAWRTHMFQLVEETNRLLNERDQILETNHENHVERIRLNRIVDEFEHTISWRLTKPLRAVRRVTARPAAVLRKPTLRPKVTNAIESNVDHSQAGIRLSPMFDGMLVRLRQVALLIHPDSCVGSSAVDEFTLLTRCLANTTMDSKLTSWLVLTASGAAYPNDGEVARAARALRTKGPEALYVHAREFFANCCRFGRTNNLPLDIVTGNVLVDVSHTAAHSLHTGIQRVVRETVTRWLEVDSAVQLIHWDFAANSPRVLSTKETARFADWRIHIANRSAHDQPRELEDKSGRVLVPWNSTLVIPELAAEPDRCNAYRTMKAVGVCHLSMIAYDLIPMTASETVADGMTGQFANAVSVAKVADRISAISHATAAEYEALKVMATQQGLSGALVEAHPLPSARPVITDDDVRQARTDLQLTSAPLVLVVGSHEPRKNHVAILEAADSLWREGLRFQLVFVGGSGWKSEDFDGYCAELRGAGRDLQIVKKASEAQVWSLYRLASFSMFPSLVEGYGLPIAESLVSGTPVITSSHGSMREVAEGGGTLMIDPRQPDQVVAAMRKLLTDTELLSTLRQEAEQRVWPTWDDYARALWTHLAVIDS